MREGASTAARCSVKSGILRRRAYDGSLGVDPARRPARAALAFTGLRPWRNVTSRFRMCRTLWLSGISRNSFTE
jgi:hypothetical protein